MTKPCAVKDCPHEVRTDQTYCAVHVDERNIERWRRANARKQDIVPDEGYLALQQAKADKREQVRLQRLEKYEEHLAKQKPAVI